MKSAASSVVSSAAVATGDLLGIALAVRRIPFLQPHLHSHLPKTAQTHLCAPILPKPVPSATVTFTTVSATTITPLNNSLTPEPLPSLFQPPRAKLEPASIPRTRVGRMYEFGTLAASVGMGIMSEAVKRATGFSPEPSKSVFSLSSNNIELIVKKLSKMRGAALKMGQMLSIQDNRVVPPEIEAVFRRVQDSANYMPKWQLEDVLRSNLGVDWRQRFSSFEDVPIAAASIGQVHKAVLPTGETVAVKVQYPGVADSISSDLSNLKSLMLFGNMLPRGLYLDNMIRVATLELGLECDYTREASAAIRFQELIASSGLSVFHVPRVYPEYSTHRVLTTEYFEGVSIERAVLLDQKTRNEIGENLFRLCLMELFSFRFMQTDPNWSNFLYNPTTKKIALIDFGASREFPKKFTDDYLRLLRASSLEDYDGCIEWSRKLGFLTGYESAAMNSSHIKSLQLLSRPFMANAERIYDFRVFSDISGQVRSEIPVMLRERLTPPPDESYSLHRKLSGCFLLCTKLGSQIPCRDIFKDILDNYKFY
ncbi:hypothetical protein BASA50_006739 [Batrachochytrium salamandrivorans]|uniref:ABC1 atypical kinase-like domain-containing protein n=1 Tax=Batrachochytrium salamandrivorans TaxID=1357716 RepID=A0ABQ8F8Z6_9FUNG|nr:hypothetical protein BASA62_001376 [Batrachochytrium salamandrivorans]KAH6594268.1 hypothetical protein BASA50_006739 [Batrachochytrium salamandrivorans]